MKKILANIFDLSSHSNSYIRYLTELARDKKLALHFIHSYRRVENHMRPTAITGLGLMYPETIIEDDDRKEKEAQLSEILEPFRKNWEYINYSVGHGDLMEKLDNQSLDDAVLMCAIQKTSEYNWLNEIFGTREIQIGKETRMPCLYIPLNYDYRRPDRMLVFINDYKAEDVKLLRKMSVGLGLALKVLTNQNMTDETLGKLQRDLSGVEMSDNEISRINEINYNINKVESIVEQTRMDWLCFMNYDKSFFERIYDLNTNKLLLKSELPSIII